MLPPFFFKDVSDDGLFAWYARVIEAVADPRLRVLPLSHPASVRRPALPWTWWRGSPTAFPGVIAGVKDSARRLGAHVGAARARAAARDPRRPRAASAAPAARRRRRDDLRRRERVSGDGRGAAAAVGRDGRTRRASPAFIEIAVRAIRSCRRSRRSVRRSTGDPGWRAVRPPWRRSARHATREGAARRTRSRRHSRRRRVRTRR